ncbi:hypothetical protein DFJ73DRAFT_828959 [Zopfochytrium polystomum]|nr:hypothetical protein DFJ73DRAFT_828959 [Zopfochytrium polystomum]
MTLAALAAATAPPASSVQLVLATAAAGAFTCGLFAAIHMLVLEWWTHLLYSKLKVLKRRDPVDESDRLVWGKIAPMALLTTPPLLLLARLFLQAAASGSVDWRLSAPRAAASMVLLTVLFDANYYFVHRAMHEVPFLYRTLHKWHHHHNTPGKPPRPRTVTYVENLLAATPALVLWVYAADALLCSPAAGFNPWIFVLPAFTVIMEVNTMHAGFLDHWLLYLASPLRWVVAVLPFARTDIAAEHEVHHAKGRKNYAPIFRLLDILGGSNEMPAVAEYVVAGEGVGTARR